MKRRVEMERCSGCGTFDFCVGSGGGNGAPPARWTAEKAKTWYAKQPCWSRNYMSGDSLE